MIFFYLEIDKTEINDNTSDFRQWKKWREVEKNEKFYR